MSDNLKLKNYGEKLSAQEEVKEEYRSKHGWIYSKNILHASGRPTFTKKDKHGFSTFATIDNVIDIETSLLQQEVEKLREQIEKAVNFIQDAPSKGYNPVTSLMTVEQILNK